MTGFEEDSLDFPIADAIDHLILMHRDAHFGGKFSFMLEYYANAGRGVHPDLPIERIQALATLEAKTSQNLSALHLTGSEADKVAKARQLYKELRDLYESPHKKNPLPELIADLILTEEPEPEQEIEAIISQQGAIVPLLINLIRSEDFRDPLFPGYGQTPAFAVRCLGKIKDKRAIIALFEMLGEEDFFTEELILDALKAIGDEAKKFLLTVVKGSPLNIDNEKAAIALIAFKDDPCVAKTALEMLKRVDVRKDIALATYLIFCCEGLEEEDKEAFKRLRDDPVTPSQLKMDFNTVIQSRSF